MMIDYTGQQIGNYRLARRLGIGGFASVYQGQHIRLVTQQAAIKILHVSDVDIQKFQQEAETTAALVHPNIIRLFDFDLSNGTPFLVMDYAPGGSLRTRHPQRTQLPLSTVIEYVKVLAGALQYAHDKNIIHRDIKPENILIGTHEELRLSDFGIAVLSQTGRTTLNPVYGTDGTPFYMAPEQCKGKPEKASDQYALAIMVYEWLCGNPPFTEGNAINIQYQHTHEPVPPLHEKRPTLLKAIEQVILKALAKDPKQRYVSVLAFAHALEWASQSEKPSVGETGQTTPPSSQLSPPQVEGVSRQASQVPSIATYLTVTRASPRTHSSSLDSDAPEAKPIQLWSIDKRRVVSMVVGSALYAGLAQFGTSLQLPGLPSWSFPIFPAIVILLFFGAVFGPWVGLCTGALGYLLEQYLSGNSFVWSENLGLILVGFIAGFAILRTRGRYFHARAIILAEGICAIGIVVGIGCGAYGDILASKFTVEVATKAFISDTLPDLLMSMTLLPILLLVYSKVDTHTRNVRHDQKTK